MNHFGRVNPKSLKTTAVVFASAALLGSVLAFAVFAAIGAKSAEAHECPPAGCITEGRMTGGGKIVDDTNSANIATHGFELRCDINDSRDNLEINWNGGNNFHLDSLTQVRCLDDPTIQPQPPSAPFDRYEADGFGSYNGVSGYRIHFEFTDAGEPGSSDHAFIVIHGGSPDTVVLNINGFLHEGNHQAHKA
jgi:hypothetical protein